MAIMVVVNRELADNKSRRFTKRGIVTCSAGAKNWVMVESMRVNVKRMTKPNGNKKASWV